MRRASVLAAPSLTAADGDAEGLPNVVVEAAASGLPVVATTHSGIPEAVEDGTTGFLVPENDAEALAARLADVLGSEPLRREMGAAARRLAERKFDRQMLTERLEAIYDRVAGFDRQAPA
jgi:glycosyltransferase involved in cell wall biosynthesis